MSEDSDMPVFRIFRKNAVRAAMTQLRIGPDCIEEGSEPCDLGKMRNQHSYTLVEKLLDGMVAHSPTALRMGVSAGIRHSFV
jgi:hypothetical protein